MEILPEDVVWNYLIKKLKEYDFIFVCKYTYNCFWNKIKENKLIMNRYERISEAYEELKQKDFVVKFDRMYTLIDLYVMRHIVQVKILCNSSVSVNHLSIHLTYDNVNGERHAVDMDTHYKTIGYYYYYPWMNVGESFFIESWHGNNVYKDNNHGSCYTYSNKDHWIPQVCKSVITGHDFYGRNCVSLLEWCLTNYQ